MKHNLEFIKKVHNRNKFKPWLTEVSWADPKTGKTRKGLMEQFYITIDLIKENERN